MTLTLALEVAMANQKFGKATNKCSLLTMPRTMKHEPMNAKQNMGPASYTYTE